MERKKNLIKNEPPTCSIFSRSLCKKKTVMNELEEEKEEKTAEKV